MRLFYLRAFLLLSCPALFAQKITNMTLVGQCELGGFGSGACIESAGANDVWGYEAGGIEYALMGVREGTVIYDVTTDPANPTQVAFISGPTSIWRDIKTYSNYAYIVHDDVTSGTPVGLQIVDLSGLPTSASVVATYNTTFNRAHNIFIDATDATLYVCLDHGTASGFNSRGIHILSLASPTSPVEIGVYNNRAVHDVYVRNNIAYAAALSQGLWFINVTDKTSPTDITSVAYPGALTHNVWLTDDGNYALTTDENLGGHLRIWDISDLTGITQVSEYETRPGDQLVIHNVFVKGNYAYISYYTEGVIILDISDPTQPCEIGYYDTDLFVVPMPHTLSQVERGVWGVYPFTTSGKIFASDIQQGLFVFEFVPPVRPPIDIILVLDISGSMESVAVPGGDRKIDVLKDAVEIFLNTWLAFAVPDDRMGIVYFESGVTKFPTGPPPVLKKFCTNFQEFVDQVRGISTGNFTAMGGGLLTAFRGFDPASSNRKAVILFTDGMQNFSPMVVESEIEAVFFDLGNTLAFRPTPTSDFVWFPDAMATVADLKARGVRVGIITNTPAGWTRSDLEAILDDPSFLDEFEVILLSSEAPCSKPCLGIYEHALSLLPNPPPKFHVAFVTEEIDHITNASGTGAQGAGWRGILKSTTPSPDAEFNITNLSEIPGIVDAVATPTRHEILTVPTGPGVYGESGVPGEPAKTIADFDVDLHSIGVGVTPSYEDLLADIAAETEDGLFDATNEPDDALREFFEVDLVNALRGTTVELIRHNLGSLSREKPSAVETFTLNKSVRQATFVVSWRKARYRSAVEVTLISPSGVEVNLSGKLRQGDFYSIVSIPFPLRQDTTLIQPQGTWTIRLKGNFKQADFIPYHASVLVDERELKYDFSPRQFAFATEAVIPLSVAVKEGLTPVKNLEKVEVTITRPSISLAATLAKNHVDRSELAKTNFGIHEDHFPRLVEKKIYKLKQDGVLKDSTLTDRLGLFDDGQHQHGDAVAGDGIYSALYVKTMVPGQYELKFQLAGQAPKIGQFSRTEQFSLLVRVQKADIAKTVVTASLQQIQPDGSQMYLISVTPRDVLDNLLGPGYPDKIKITSSAGKLGTLEDDLEGSYTRTLTLQRSDPDPTITITVLGEVVRQAKLSDLIGAKRRFFVSAHLGVVRPHGDLDREFNPGISFIADFGIRLTRSLSLEALLGYHRLKGDVGFDDNPYLTVSGNLKRYFSLTSVRPFVNGGLGIYIPDEGDSEFGSNVGSGVSFHFTPNISFDLSYNLHLIFRESDTAQFSTLHSGIRLGF